MFVLDGSLFKLAANGPAFVPLFQFAPRSSTLLGARQLSA